MEQGLGHHQLRLGESGFLPQMGWERQRSHPNQGPVYLDPLNPQTKYSSALLNLFRFLVQSPEYVTRLKRHYQMFRESVDRRDNRSHSQQTNRIENRRKHIRDLKRRRPHSR
jgi:hypothetical protein